MIGNLRDDGPATASKDRCLPGLQEEIGCHKHILMGRQTPAPIHTHNDRLWNDRRRLVPIPRNRGVILGDGGGQCSGSRVGRWRK